MHGDRQLESRAVPGHKLRHSNMGYDHLNLPREMAALLLKYLSGYPSWANSQILSTAKDGQAEAKSQELSLHLPHG